MAASLQVEEEVLEAVQRHLGVLTSAAMGEPCRPVRGACLAGVVEEAPLRDSVEPVEHSSGQRTVAERGMLGMGRPRNLRSASLGVVEVAAGPVSTETTSLEDPNVRISRRPVWAEGRQNVALAAKDRGAASVLAGRLFQTWPISGVLAAAAVLLFVGPAEEALPNANVEARREEGAAVLVQLRRSR